MPRSCPETCEIIIIALNMCQMAFPHRQITTTSLCVARASLEGRRNQCRLTKFTVAEVSFGVTEFFCMCAFSSTKIRNNIQRGGLIVEDVLCIQKIPDSIPDNSSLKESQVVGIRKGPPGLSSQAEQTALS